MSTPTSPRRSTSHPLEREPSAERSTSLAKPKSGRIGKSRTITAVSSAGKNRPATGSRVNASRAGADDPAMARSVPAPARREAGVSFPMTTTAQVEHRDAIRARTQARLDALRARTA